MKNRRDEIEKIIKVKQSGRYLHLRYEGGREYYTNCDGEKVECWCELIRPGLFWGFIYKEEEEDVEAGKYVEYEDMKINYIWNHGCVGLKVHYNKNGYIFKVTK